MFREEPCRVAFVWSPDFEKFDYGPNHPIRHGRFCSVRDFLEARDLLNQSNVVTIKAEPLPDDLLNETHSQEYLTKVREISKSGVGSIDIDTPGFRGIYENARITCGATVSGIDAILTGRAEHFYSPTGGFHHAMRGSGGGFCVFNDIAAAVFRLKHQGFKRILVADFDVHHGNGTESYFYHDPGVMQISFHEDPEWMYPHTGRIDNTGSGEGRGYKINMPFPMDSGDAVYRYAFDELVPSLVDFYRPEFVLFLPGFDAHYLDKLAHLKLTTRTIRYVAQRIHDAAHRWSSGRLGVLTGGGYSTGGLFWGTSSVMSVLTGIPYESPEETPPFGDDKATWEEVKRNVGLVEKAVFPTLGIV